MVALKTSFRPIGTFGVASNDNVAPYIFSMYIRNGGQEDYIDQGDNITINFSEPINPALVNGNLAKNGVVPNVPYSSTGGVSVASDGTVTIKNIVAFDAGSVANSGNFTSKANLSSSGKVLIITITNGSSIAINNENFASGIQFGGAIYGESGEKMKYDGSIDNPAGTFGGASGGYNNVSNDSSNDSSSSIYAQIALLQQQIAALQQQLAGKTGGSGLCAQISQTLFYGRSTNDAANVSCLQSFLTSQGYQVTVSGIYDLATKGAVMQFQQKYADMILVPFGLTQGSGNVGVNTLAQINQLLGQE
jgi:hypothetical protein